MSEQENGTVNDGLTRLARLAREQVDAEVRVEEAEAAVKAAKDALRVISEGSIPELMEHLGVEEYRTSDGIKVVVRTDVRASIKADNQAVAFKWLRDHGHASLIKEEIKILPDDFAQLRELAQRFKDEEVDFEVNAKVAPQTLAKFVREKLEEGADIPLELFGVFRQRVSKVEIPKR